MALRAAWALGGLAVLGLPACGGAMYASKAPTPTAGASAGPTTAKEKPSGGSNDPFRLQGRLREEELVLLDRNLVEPPAFSLPPAPPGVLPAPARCEAFTKRRPEKPLACGDRKASLSSLDRALALPDAAQRDATLLALEACAEMPAGLMRALRGELAPHECGDVLAEPVLVEVSKGTKKIESLVYQTLLAQSLAARLTRAVASPPKLAAPFEKQRVSAYIKGPLTAWISEQAGAIQSVSLVAAKLSSYARGLVALETGLAEMRFVEVVRTLPVPVEFTNDRELKDVYFGSLDQILEPRKQRGRDAALVGLRDFAAVGILHDDRLSQVRSQLSKVYGGRRVDSLDSLVLPAGGALPAVTVEERLAAKLPTFYASLLLPAPEKPADLNEAVLRALLEQGIPVSYRKAMRGEGLSSSLRMLALRSHVALGQTYWRAANLDQAALLASQEYSSGHRTEEVSFWFALALALRGGPTDTAIMMIRAPIASLGMGNVAALDAVAENKGVYGSMAQLNAARLLEISPPDDADRAYWRGVAQRYREVAPRLHVPHQRKMAEQGALAADELAKAVRK